MTTSTVATTVERLLETVRQIEPVLRQYSQSAERARRLPDDVVVAMRERGLYRLWRPRIFGGLERDSDYCDLATLMRQLGVLPSGL